MIWILLLVCKCQTKDESIVYVGITTEWTGTINQNFIYIVRADGYIHYINILTGEVIWSHDTGGSIFGSSETRKGPFIPSIDGYLFSFNGYGYQRISVPIRDIVFVSPIQTESGMVFTSGKSMTMHEIDEKGNLIKSYHPNSSIPSPGASKDRVRIFRIDYLLNILTKHSSIIHFSEFDVLSDDAELGSPQKINVITTFSGSVSISINGSIVSQLKLNGTPISIISTSGKFDFEMSIDGHPIPESSVALMEIFGYNVAIPAKPLTTPPNYDVLTSGVPMLPEYPGGLFDVRSQFPHYDLLHSNLDSSRLAEQILGNLLDVYPCMPNFSYTLISISLFLVFLILRMIQIYYAKLKRALASSVQIIIDDAENGIGRFNNVLCSIVFTPLQKEPILKEINDLGHPYSVKIRAFVKKDDTIIVACQPLQQFDFSGMNPTLFIKRMMEVLISLHKRGLVHGSIDKNCIFADNDGLPIIGGFQQCCHFSNNPEEKADDIKSIAKIVQEYSNSTLLSTPNNHNNSSNDDISNSNIMNNDSVMYGAADMNLNKYTDPLLIDLLREMLTDDYEERPTPDEILCHPLFLSGVQKLELIAHASDFLQSKSRNKRFIALFEQHSKEIVGGNWMRFLDSQLLQDAINHRDYQGESTVDLIRFIRNKWHHMPTMPNGHTFNTAGSNAEDYFAYFHARFPNFFLYLYYFIDHYDIDANNGGL